MEDLCFFITSFSNSLGIYVRFLSLYFVCPHLPQKRSPAWNKSLHISLGMSLCVQIEHFPYEDVWLATTRLGGVDFPSPMLTYKDAVPIPNKTSARECIPSLILSNLSKYACFFFRILSAMAIFSEKFHSTKTGNVSIVRVSVSGLFR